MVKRWKAFKRPESRYKHIPSKLPKAIHLEGCRAVFHKIEVTEEVATPDGPMIAVHIRNKMDLCDPNNDIAALVGKIAKYRKSGVYDPQSPEIWYWNDKLWAKAIDSSGLDYYHKTKAYLFYEIQIENQDEFLGKLAYA